MDQGKVSPLWLPFWTLLKKECLRFLVVPAQTLFAPVVTASLFLFIFGVNLGRKIDFPGYTYLQFVVPGLALMGVISNAFANTSSSLFFSRYIGNIVDLLVTPLSATQFILAYTLAAVLRGMLVGTAVILISFFFTDLPWTSPAAAAALALLTAFQMSQLGLIAAIYSESFEAVAMYTNFLVMPLVYLGGMFYPLSVLPPFWRTASHFNPLFYAIDGFRHAILGVGDVSLGVAFAVMGALSTVLFVWASVLIHRGYRLRQ